MSGARTSGAVESYPVKPGDWLADEQGRVATVKAVYRSGGDDVVADLYLYDHSGKRMPRQSPALGGPRSFEPACSLIGWHRLAREPVFPIHLVWSEAEADGRRRAVYHVGESAPWRTWTPPKRKARSVVCKPDDVFRHALERIAAGDNDARRVAQEALRWATPPGGPARAGGATDDGGEHG